MASLSKQALQVENVSSFPNNTTNYITPAILRSFNSDIIDSTVNQGEYTANSGSWNQQIDALEQFTASQQPSFTALNAFTASQLTINSGVNLFTQSANSSISQLNAYTASFTTSVGIYDENNFVNNVNQINFSGNGITASYVSGKGVVSVDFTPLNNFTASQAVTNTQLNSFTASQLSINSGYNSFTSSQLSFNSSATASISQLLSFSSSLDATFATDAELAAATASLIAQINTKLNTSSFNSYTQSNDQRVSSLEANSASVNISITNVNSATASLFTSVNNLNSATASLNTSASLGLTTASFDNGTRNLTFTKGDASTFSVNIPDVSGSTLPSGLLSSSVTNFTDYSASVDSRILAITGSSINTGSFATTGSNTFTGTQTINADLTVSGSANLGFVNIIDNGGINLYGTGSTRQSYGIVTNPSNGDLVFNTNPGNGRLMTFNETNGIMNLWNGMKLDTSFIGIDVYDHPLYLSSSYGGMTTMLSAQGNVVVSGSLITTGSAVVTGTMIVAGVPNINYTSGSGIGEVYLLADSGSLIIGNSQSTPTYAALAHLSSSAVNTNTNLIFKPNTLTGDTIISGSSNIFTNPGNPTAGFKRYIGGSQNYFGSTLPQISGSTGFSPTFTSNILNSGFIMRTPVSSSAYTFNSNMILGAGATAINLGTAAGTNFERAVSGLAMSNNIVNGTVNAIASKTPLSASISITNNNIGGTANLNMDSSSINLSTNIIQGTLTVNNSYFPSTINTATSLGINSGLFIGTHTVYASGSNTTFTGPRNVNNSGMIGNANVISASLNGDNTNVNSTILLGQGLVAVGTNTRQAGPTMPDWGTVFVGRFNSIDGVKDQTAETIFAVGTGTSDSVRKTAFLIDSGSNVFVEGTLNVSGSTFHTGSIYIQSGSWIPSATGSSVLTWNSATGQVSQSPIATLISSSFSVGAFNSTVTQSGSAAVSQSMTLNNTDISNGISVVSNSQITFAITGTYNIQFSAQLLSSSGQDDVYIWIKKNGTNVANTATKVILANNDAIVAAWNWVVTANAGDYYELVWQSRDGHATISAAAATGNIPGIPSLIVTATQVE